MSLSLAERNKNWNADPKRLGASVNRRHQSGVTANNSRDDTFYALYTSFSPERTDFDEYVDTATYTDLSQYLFRFTDKANPFYGSSGSREPRMYAVLSQRVDTIAKTLREHGYTVEVRDDTSQFGFIPRPTLGEIVVTGRDINAVDS